MNTKTHLKIIYAIVTILLAISFVGVGISFIAIIAGESPVPFFICLPSFLCLYISWVVFIAFIEIYDAVVLSKKTRKHIVRENLQVAPKE